MGDRRREEAGGKEIEMEKGVEKERQKGMVEGEEGEERKKEGERKEGGEGEEDDNDKLDVVMHAFNTSQG